MGKVNIRNPLEYIRTYLYIRDKKSRLVKLEPNPAQMNLYGIIKEEAAAGRPVRLLILKGRQEGISTMTEALMFQDSATRKGVKTLIVAHQSDSTDNLFKMNKLFYDCLPAWLQPMLKASNARELVFENPTRDKKKKKRRPGLRSSIRCATAGGKAVGRGDTFNNVHLSEFAFWGSNKKELLLGIMQSVPDDPSTMAVIESTANGFDYFKELWDGAVAGTNGWRPVFLPWYLEENYRKPVAPGTEWTEEERKLQELYGLDEEQLSWRRWCIAANCGGDEATFRQEYPNTPEEAFLLSGNPFFPQDAVAALLKRLRGQQPWRGRFIYDPTEKGAAPYNWQLEEEKNGIVTIFKAPEKGVPYVIGGDTAGDGSDYFTAHVLDNRTGEQVAEIKMLKSELEYARQIYCLGYHYNTALIGVEVNFSTYPEKKLEEWYYPKLYQRERVDTFTGKLVKAFGWNTSSKTRPLALQTLHTVVEEAPECIQSFALVSEMQTFVKDETGWPAAAENAHDDLVLAAAIAHAIRPQQRYEVEKTEGKRNWTKDMWEDYNAADEATRAMLRERWK